MNQGSVSRLKWKPIAIGCLVLFALALIISRSTTPIPITADDQEYTRKVYEQTSGLSVVVGKLTELSADPKIGDEQWTSLLVSQADLLEDYALESKKLKAPERFKDVDKYYKLAMEEYRQVKLAISNNRHRLDTKIMQQAAKHSLKGEEYIKKATIEYDKLGIQ